MKFFYRYQDKSKGILEGEISASSEADVYSTLRKSGIRPMKVWPKPGVINRISALGKRGAAILLLSVCVVALVAVSLSYRREAASVRGQFEDESIARPLVRQQCKKVDVPFKFETERFLANFICPGDETMVSKAGMNAGLLSAGVAVVIPDFSDSLKSPIRIDKGDSAEVVVVKRIVAGLKEEARRLELAGKNSSEIFDFFIARQCMEVSYRQKVVEDLRSSFDAEVPREKLETINETLRVTGLREIDEKECGSKD